MEDLEKIPKIEETTAILDRIKAKGINIWMLNKWILDKIENLESRITGLEQKEVKTTK